MVFPISLISGSWDRGFGEFIYHSHTRKSEIFLLYKDEGKEAGDPARNLPAHPRISDGEQNRPVSCSSSRFFLTNAWSIQSHEEGI